MRECEKKRVMARRVEQKEIQKRSRTEPETRFESRENLFQAAAGSGIQ
jgi:hypothetical protein